MAEAPTPPHKQPLLSEFAGDPDMGELVTLFVSEMPGRLSALQAAWTTGHVQSLVRMAHQLKGSSPGYGFPAIGQAAATLEDRLRELAERNQDGQLESFHREFTQLIDLCRRASAA
jgi:HPt (histidine-containing phosphotransfer) domain-containing protein